MEKRELILGIIEKKTSLEEKWRRDLEIGIYNWCLEYADKNNMIKSWDNIKFANLYVEKARSVITNLDSTSYIGNKYLIKKLMNKEFLPHEIPFLKPEHSYPDMWQEIQDKYNKKFQHAFENREVAMTDMYRCGKCKKRECNYYELQTRSADESASIFIKCLPCGNSWRIG